MSAASERYAADQRQVEKPWGWELVWAETEHYAGKLLFVRAGEARTFELRAAGTAAIVEVAAAVYVACARNHRR